MFGPILSWLVDNEASVVARAGVALLPKDVVRVGLTGEPCTDRSDASATLLWDVTEDAWALDIAARTGVPDRLLPAVVASEQVTGVTSWLAKTVGGGPDDVPVVAGGGDTPVAMLVAGSRGLHINLGTGAQVLLAGVAADTRADPDTHLYGDTEGGWYAMAAVQNAGLALDWVMTVLGLSWEDLVTVLSAPAPRRGVSFLPFLTGERGAWRSRTVGRRGSAWTRPPLATTWPERRSRRSFSRSDGPSICFPTAPASADGPCVVPHRWRRSRTRPATAAGGRPRPGGATGGGAQLVSDRCRRAGGAPAPAVASCRTVGRDRW